MAAGKWSLFYCPELPGGQHFGVCVNIDASVRGLLEQHLEVTQIVAGDENARAGVGNGASINTLMEAGIETADILIAVTVSDEMNLLCCLIAQKTGHCQTIARVRNRLMKLS